MATPQPRITLPTLKVLGAIASTDEMAGADVTRKTGVKSGTLYAMLRRLEAAGWLARRDEDGDPSVKGRPLKRLYRMTALGRERTRQAMAEATGAANHKARGG